MISPTRYVFIRDNKAHSEFSERLANDLRQSFIDARRAVGSLRPGSEWAKESLALLEQADATIFVLDEQFGLNLAFWAVSNENTFFVTESTTNINSITVVVSADRTFEQPLISFGIDYDQGLAQLLALIPKKLRHNQPLAPEKPVSRGYVFISYAEEDTAFVTKLSEFLKTRSYGYWDYQDSERDYHNFLFLELEEVIENAAATISVMSPDWKRSKWAAKEFLYSEEVNTPVFLLKVQEMEPTLVTVGIPYIDFTRDEPKGFEKLDNELRRKGLI